MKSFSPTIISPAVVAIQLPDGRVAAVHVRYDGRSIGEDLLLRYDNFAAAYALVGLGDQRWLGEGLTGTGVPLIEWGDVKPRMFNSVSKYVVEVSRILGSPMQYVFCRDPQTGTYDWYGWGPSVRTETAALEPDDPSLMSLGAGVVGIKIEKVLGMAS
jgi:hypothetical protein